jgi:hypothetical protein
VSETVPVSDVECVTDTVDVSVCVTDTVPVAEPVYVRFGDGDVETLTLTVTVTVGEFVEHTVAVGETAAAGAATAFVSALTAVVSAAE